MGKISKSRNRKFWIFWLTLVVLGNAKLLTWTKIEIYIEQAKYRIDNFRFFDSQFLSKIRNYSRKSLSFWCFFWLFSSQSFRDPDLSVKNSKKRKFQTKRSKTSASSNNRKTNRFKSLVSSREKKRIFLNPWTKV